MSDEQALVDTLKVGDAWGEAISQERQAKLRVLADKQREWAATLDAGLGGDGAFYRVRLTGADVFWLASCALAGPESDVAAAAGRLQRAAQGHWILRKRLVLSNLHLEAANLTEAHLESAFLRGAHLEGSILMRAHLGGANLSEAHLEGANLGSAYLGQASLNEVSTNLRAVHLEAANLGWARLDGADLIEAHLEGADLTATHLEGANLTRAHLEGKRLPREQVLRLRQWTRTMSVGLTWAPRPADLRGAFFSAATILGGATLWSTEFGFVQVADVRWGDVNLAVVKWIQPSTGKRHRRPKAVVLGDESQARKPNDGHGKPKDAETRLAGFEVAVRANRQLATALRDQGLNEDADRFAYRAQVLQREVLRRQRQYGRALFSGFLDALAGYGFKPGRSLISYLVAILGFAIAYYFIGQAVGPHLSPLGAFVFSMTSFHGRGFFPGGIALDDPITGLAAFEAFVGLVIEVSFIATFTQRFFGR